MTARRKAKNEKEWDKKKDLQPLIQSIAGIDAAWHGYRNHQQPRGKYPVKRIHGRDLYRFSVPKHSSRKCQWGSRNQYCQNHEPGRLLHILQPDGIDKRHQKEQNSRRDEWVHHSKVPYPNYSRRLSSSWFLPSCSRKWPFWMYLCTPIKGIRKLL